MEFFGKGSLLIPQCLELDHNYKQSCLPLFWTSMLCNASVAASWLSHSSQYIVLVGMIRYPKNLFCPGLKPLTSDL